MRAPVRRCQSPYGSHYMELSVPAGNLETEFFRTGLPVPDRPACGEALPPAGATIDNTDPCFQAFGKSQYWRGVNNAGIGGDLIWTNAFENERPSNWAQWRFLLTTPGEYEVEVHTVQDYSKYDAVRYEVRTPAGPQEVIADLKDYDGWYSLGVFTFDTADEYSVSVFDNYSGQVGDDLHITADAIRLIGTNTEPMEPVEPIPPMGGSPTPVPEPEQPDEVEDPMMEMPAQPDEPMIQDMTNNSMKPNVLPSTANPRGVEQEPRVTRVYYEAGCNTQNEQNSSFVLICLLGLMGIIRQIRF